MNKQIVETIHFSYHIVKDENLYRNLYLHAKILFRYRNLYAKIVSISAEVIRNFSRKYH